MARNSEKAMTALARWRAAHCETAKEKRPYLASECDDLKKAEMFRRQIIGEITRMTQQIQNAGLGEYKLRDLNDEINKKMREKRHWEVRIRELGGHDFRKFTRTNINNEDDGYELPRSRGYRYFGATRDLPGVKELFEKDPPGPPKKTKAELMANIDIYFYGHMAEEDEAKILQSEKELEVQVRERKIAEKKAKLSQDSSSSSSVSQTQTPTTSVFESSLEDSSSKTNPTCMAYVAVPTQKDYEQALLARKKREILEQYASADLISNEQDTKAMLGLN